MKKFRVKMVVLYEGVLEANTQMEVEQILLSVPGKRKPIEYLRSMRIEDLGEVAEPAALIELQEKR